MRKKNFFPVIFILFSNCVLLIKMNENNVVTFVTGNQNKLNEVISILGPDFPYKLVNEHIDLPEYQGEIDSICKKKCSNAIQLTKTSVLVEDSSLCFNALGGLPGPYIKWFLEKLGPEGLHKLLADFPNKDAIAVCTLGYADQSGNITIFRGETEGEIVEPKGKNGFGWDSCFLPKGYNQTYAEMPQDLKNSISHRNKAVLKFRSYIMKL